MSAEEYSNRDPSFSESGSYSYGYHNFHHPAVFARSEEPLSDSTSVELIARLRAALPPSYFSQVTPDGISPTTGRTLKEADEVLHLLAAANFPPADMASEVSRTAARSPVALAAGSGEHTHATLSVRVQAPPAMPESIDLEGQPPPAARLRTGSTTTCLEDAASGYGTSYHFTRSHSHRGAEPPNHIPSATQASDHHAEVPEAHSVITYGGSQPAPSASVPLVSSPSPGRRQPAPSPPFFSPPLSPSSRRTGGAPAPTAGVAGLSIASPSGGAHHSAAPPRERERDSVLSVLLPPTQAHGGSRRALAHGGSCTRPPALSLEQYRGAFAEAPSEAEQEPARQDSLVPVADLSNPPVSLSNDLSLSAPLPAVPAGLSEDVPPHLHDAAFGDFVEELPSPRIAPGVSNKSFGDFVSKQQLTVPRMPRAPGSSRSADDEDHSFYDDDAAELYVEEDGSESDSATPSTQVRNTPEVSPPSVASSAAPRQSEEEVRSAAQAGSVPAPRRKQEGVPPTSPQSYVSATAQGSRTSRTDVEKHDGQRLSITSTPERSARPALRPPDMMLPGNALHATPGKTEEHGSNRKSRAKNLFDRATRRRSEAILNHLQEARLKDKEREKALQTAPHLQEARLKDKEREKALQTAPHLQEARLKDKEREKALQTAPAPSGRWRQVRHAHRFLQSLHGHSTRAETDRVLHHDVLRARDGAISPNAAPNDALSSTKGLTPVNNEEKRDGGSTANPSLPPVTVHSTPSGSSQSATVKDQQTSAPPSPPLVPDQPPCESCGAPRRGLFCTSCGHRATSPGSPRGPASDKCRCCGVPSSSAFCRSCGSPCTTEACNLATEPHPEHGHDKGAKCARCGNPVAGKKFCPNCSLPNSHYLLQVCSLPDSQNVPNDKASQRPSPCSPTAHAKAAKPPALKLNSDSGTGLGKAASFLSNNPHLKLELASCRQQLRDGTLEECGDTEMSTGLAGPDPKCDDVGGICGKVLRQYFDILDEDNEGVISKAALADLLPVVGSEVTHAELDGILIGLRMARQDKFSFTDVTKLFLLINESRRDDSASTDEHADCDVDPVQAAETWASRMSPLHGHHAATLDNIASARESGDQWAVPAGPSKYRLDASESKAVAPSTIPTLDIVIAIVGSRGDVQPFIALALELMKYDHVVTILTHEEFRTFVTKFQIRFAPIGGDPKALMTFMSEHPDIIALNPREIRTRKKMMEDIFSTAIRYFESHTADILIANPPVLIHHHIAEAYALPLQLHFTMPWSETAAYEHPFAPIGAGVFYGNRKSYQLHNEMVWLGLGGLINGMRQRLLGLPPIVNRGGHVVSDMQIPHIYCMSPVLVPKPLDWGPHIEVVGFWNLAEVGLSDYEPPRDLVDFLQAGPMPVYIGFGSVSSFPSGLARAVLDALEITGIRAVIGAGWGFSSDTPTPPTVKIIQSAPHDWLFEHVYAVCHHGGAGTTACGLRHDKPTIVVPFFGDQYFWGSCIQRLGCGPCPIPAKRLTATRLAAALRFCQKDTVLRNVRSVGLLLRAENGLQEGMTAIFRQLPLDSQGNMCVYSYEHERSTNGKWLPHPVMKKRWTDHSGLLCRPREGFTLKPGWRWVTDWMRDRAAAGTWQYAKSERGPWSLSVSDARIRRRRWVRRMTRYLPASQTTTAPSVTSPPLQLDPVPAAPVPVDIPLNPAPELNLFQIVSDMNRPTSHGGVLVGARTKGMRRDTTGGVFAGSSFIDWILLHVYSGEDSVRRGQIVDIALYLQALKVIVGADDEHFPFRDAATQYKFTCKVWERPRALQFIPVQTIPKADSVIAQSGASHRVNSNPLATSFTAVAPPTVTRDSVSRYNFESENRPVLGWGSDSGPKEPSPNNHLAATIRRGADPRASSSPGLILTSPMGSRKSYPRVDSKNDPIVWGSGESYCSHCSGNGCVECLAQSNDQSSTFLSPVSARACDHV